MRRCAFLTTSGLDGFVVDDHLAHGPLEERGWAVEAVPWKAPRDWGAYDVVIIRSTWDYTRDPGRFLAVLETIDRSPALLLNPLELVRWNLDKRYLRSLQAWGVPVVPSTWGKGLTRIDLQRAFQRLASRELVVKPAVGANAEDAFRFDRSTVDGMAGDLERRYAGRPYVIQPFLPAVVHEGEFSLFFFDGGLSHAVLKRPRQEDFRVQEEHGADILPVRPPEGVRRAAARAMAVLPRPPLYARVDLVRHRGDYVVMELELIEPSLYLRMHPTAPRSFARALDTWTARASAVVRPELA